MDFHKIAGIFPMLTSREIDELADDIKVNGLREPIWTYRGKIIDGRNRFKACKRAGVNPEFREWKGKGSLVRFVISQNLHRRHLTSSQRATIATDIVPILKREAKQRQKTAGGDRKSPRAKRTGSLRQKVDKAISQPPATQQAAAATGTNRQYVHDATKIRQEDPKLFKEVQQGKTSLPKAKQQLAQQAAPAKPKHAKAYNNLAERAANLSKSFRAHGQTASKAPPKRIGEYLDAIRKLLRDAERQDLPDPSLDGIGIPEPLDSDEARASLKDWLKHHRQIGKPYKSPDSVSRLLRTWAERGSAAFVEAVEHSIANNYQGLFSPRSNDGNGRNKQGPGQRHDPRRGSGKDTVGDF